MVPDFVEFIPDVIEPGVLYISIPYHTAVHSCACGCGSRVVTPIKPTDWSLTWNGETASLRPSIGNWSFPCKSHYWILDNKVVWSRLWSDREIEAGRDQERRARGELPGGRKRRSMGFGQ